MWSFGKDQPNYLYIGYCGNCYDLSTHIIKHLSEVHYNFQFVRCILHVYVKFLLVCSESVDGGYRFIKFKMAQS